MTAIAADQVAPEGQTLKLLAAVFDQYAPLLYRYSLRMCRDQIKADQIVGNVFAQLLERLEAGEGPRNNLSAYLYKLTYHFIVEHVQEQPASLLAGATNIRDREKDRLPSLDDQNLLDVVASVITNELSDEQQQVVILRFQEEFDLNDTATILGKDINTVKAIQGHAIAKLQNALAGRNYEP